MTRLMILPFNFLPQMLIAHSACGIPATHAYEKDSRLKVCFRGLVNVSIDADGEGKMNVRVGWNTDVPAAAVRHGPLIAGCGRNEAVVLVDLEEGVV
jgi:hypothetical protein